MSVLKIKKLKISSRERKLKKNEKSVPSVPEGMWVKCPECGEMLYREDVVKNYYICYKCGGYFRVKAKNRIRMIADRHTFEEWDADMEFTNPLDFPGYEEKIRLTREKTKLNEAVLTGKVEIYGKEAVVGICDTRFFMGSMGQIVGEKITRAVERATKECLPLILFTCSGGARMQEGILSLMQMAKTSAALKKHSEAGLFYLTVLTDPTTGGVTASFAMLGDVILAEPGALIGFAGPRVIEQTIGAKLPEGFQRAEFLQEKGFVDAIVERGDLKHTLHQLICLHEHEPEVTASKMYDKSDVSGGSNAEIVQFEGQSRKSADQLSAWEKVQEARSQKRLTSMDYIEFIFDDFMELHGDRLFRDDGAVVGGLAYLDGKPVTVIGQQKGRSLKENEKRNFGMPYPEGYRKALRLMKQAEKFGRPIINFVDTPGAFCGLEAEERGQGEAIARNLMEMSDLSVPVLSVMIGEGGSGGALALAVGNEVWMLENAIYSILSPEGFASILWKDSKRAEEAASIMKLTAEDLKNLDVIEEIISETVPASVESLPQLAADMKERMCAFVKKYESKTPEEIRMQRYERFRRF